MKTTKGIIRSIFLTELQIGAQVLIQNKIYLVQDPISVDTYEHKAKTLVVEFQEKGIRNGYKNQPKDVIGFVAEDYSEIVQFPLKLSQWKSAIVDGFVDTEKEIEFKIIWDKKSAQDQFVMKVAEIIEPQYTWENLNTKWLSEVKEKQTDKSNYYDWLKENYNPPTRKLFYK